MGKRYLKIFVFGGLIVIAGFLVGKETNPLLKLDGFSGMCLRVLFLTDDSEYSEGYTHEKFLKIRKGMGVEEVYAILGEPIRADMEDGAYSMLWYSWSPNSTHYRRRNIVFTDNKVSAVASFYYVD